MHIKTSFLILTALASAAAIGCGSSNKSGDVTGTARASLHRAKSCGDLLGDLKADATFKLNHAINQQIAGINACLKKYGEDKCAYYGGYIGGGGRNGGFGMDDSAQAMPTSAGGAEESGSSSSSSSGGAAPPKSSASSYSETNTQVKGVDEADIVKNDGKNLYILHGRAFKIVNAWPANDLKELATLDIEGTPNEMFVSDGKVVIYSQVNGAKVFAAAGVTPKTQFQEYGYTTYAGGFGGGGGGVAPSVARETPAPTDPSGNVIAAPEAYAPLTKITVLTLNGNTPAVTREVYFEGSYLDARRVGANVRTVLQGYQYGPKLKYSVYELYPQPTNVVGAEDSPKTDPGGPGSPNDPDVEKKPDAPSPTTPTTPVNDPYPKTGTAMISALNELRAANIATLNASQLGDWLPYTFVKNGAAVSAQTVACEDFYVPTTGSTESGLTEVASLDLNDPAATPKESAILGRTDTVYGNGDSLYLAAHAWVEPPFQWNDPYGFGGGTDGDVPVSSGTTGTAGGGGGSSGTGTEPAPDPAPPPPKGGAAGNVKTLADPATTVPIIAWSSANTHVHKFDFKVDPKFPNYVASGTVTGSIKDQFSMDDKDGFLRVATTEQRQYVNIEGQPVAPDNTTPAGKKPTRPSQVSHVFTLGQQGPWLDLAGDAGEIAPNEQIQSVRFVDGRGYVVTFRQVDPLFVFDLQNPKAPTLLAALKIPGFSEYMHPLDANHLLTIGRDADATTGRSQGLQLQIFDVTDGANPIVQHKFTYKGAESGGGSSEAEYDHKAFTYFADKNLLAFPYYSYDYNTKEGGEGGGGVRSSLELFKISVGGEGFTKVGSIDHSNLVQKSPTGYCGGYFQPSVRRGVFLENFVYSVSYGGIVAKDANNLAAAGAEVALPSPLVNQGYGPEACY